MSSHQRLRLLSSGATDFSININMGNNARLRSQKLTKDVYLDKLPASWQPPAKAGDWRRSEH